MQVDKSREASTETFLELLSVFIACHNGAHSTARRYPHWRWQRPHERMSTTHEEGIESELEALEAQVSGWKERVEHAASKLRSEHARMLAEAEQEHDRLSAEGSSLADEEAKAKERLQQKHARLQQLQEEVDEASAAESHLPDEIANLQSAIEEEMNEASAKESHVSTSRRTKHARLKAIVNAVELYKHRLALRFSTDTDPEGKDDNNGLLRLSMWNIDPEEPERTFAFSLQVLGHSPSTFRIMNVSPEVPEARVEAVQSQLHRTQSLQSLVVNMRQEFQRMLS